ncbi:RHS repeat domain-containing protein, partial [Flavobacterium reichenbachii]|uniref:RHS repeat domain-containing protein n=1 Tax=Flavobacterium reichenbachii TaxID=362418 RepID=UPI000B5C054F
DASGKYVPFGEEIKWEVQDDNLKNNIAPNIDVSGKHTLGGSSNGKSGGINYRVAVGLATQAGNFKENTVGAHGGNSWGSSETIVTLEDLDGDQLPDKVFRKGDNVYYRKNLSNQGSNSFGEIQEISLNNIGNSSSKTFNWGVGLTLGYSKISANVGFDKQYSKSNTKSYFMDFNGDGLVDFANNGKVYYNRIVDGVPTFKLGSTGTPSPVSGDGELTLSYPAPAMTFEEMQVKNPLHDAVRMWEAPVTGQIKVSHTYQLQEDISKERTEYLTNDGKDKADGVQLFFQKGNSLVWKQAITATDYISKTKEDVLTVTKGEKLFFRVSSVMDGSFDQVLWNPKISYTTIDDNTGSFLPIADNAADANLYSLKNYDAEKDFLSSTNSGLLVPNGSFTFAGNLIKPITSDHVVLKIYRKYLDEGSVENILYQKQFNANEAVSFDLSSIGAVNNTAAAQVRFVLESATNINWNTISFNPSINMPAIAPAVSENKKADVFLQRYKKRKGDYIIERKTSNIDGVLTLNLAAADLDLLPAGFNNLRSKLNGPIIITAKQNNQLVGRKRYKMVNGVLTDDLSIIEPAPLFAKVLQDQPIDLEINIPALESDAVTQQCTALFQMPVYLTVNNDDGSLWTADTDKYAVYSNFYSDELQLGLGHREWGGFVINNTGTFASDLISVAQLKTSDVYNAEPNLDPDNQSETEQQGYDIAKVYFVTMQSIYNKNNMIGLEETTFIDSKFMGTSRLGEDDIASYFDASLPSLDGGGTMALTILSENESSSFSAGLKVGPLGPGGSEGKGKSYVTQTMADFNGDRFPDYVRGKEVQFTSPTGGISAKTAEIYNYSHGESKSNGLSSDGSYSHAFTKTVQKSIPVKDSNGCITNKLVSEKEATGISVSMSLAGNLGSNEDESQYMHMDINGDGLADRIKKTGEVALNSGYGFLPEEKWNFEGLATGSSENWAISPSSGMSYKSGSFTGGFNFGKSTDNSNTLMMDVNSDGLADKVQYTGGKMMVALNMGGSFMALIEYPKFSRMNENNSTSYGLSVGFSLDIPIYIIGIRITPSLGGSTGFSTSRTEATFNDMDGDGNMDYVLSDDEDHLIVRLSNIKRTNKLKSVKNGAGSGYVVDYELTKPSYENPSSKWVLQSVDVFDGHAGDGIDHSIAKFKYEDGYQDRREREFYGFGKVTQQQIDAADNTVFMTTVQEFYNQDYFRKNLVKRSYTLDKNYKMREESENEYSFVDVAAQTSVPVSDLVSPAYDGKRIFVGLIHANQKIYEGGNDYLETNTFNTYDANGNIIQYEDLGNGSADDKVTAKISYYQSTTPYYGGIPKQMEVFTAEGLKRKRAATINTTTAQVTQIKNYASADKIAVTDIAYDTYGNLQKITGPVNYKGQRMTLEYVFDAENHQYMTEIKDAFGYQNKMEFDYRFGITTKTTDRNEQSSIYTIDSKGRPSSIKAPYEIASGKPYTIAYEYFPDAKVPYAKTSNYDPELDKDIETYTYTDGFGRALQVKKTASLFTQAGSADKETHIVSGKIIYDGLGRPITSYYPTTTTTIDNNFSTALSSVTPTETEYDEMGRVVKVTLPDGSTNTTIFALENYDGLPVLRTTQTDALNKTSQTYTDASGQNIASMQNDLLTKFETNALGEMVKVTDAMDHITKSTYDWLGRRVEFMHPDAGTSTMQYDLAGNLTTRITQDIKNTVPNGGAIEYVYNYNRLESIKYPKNPQNNVQYNYGKADGTAARRGRLWFVQDASGGQEFFYGKLGEIEKEIRTLRITPTDVQTYISKYEYDTWNRIQKMTYPDGEVVDYTYNRAGKLQSMQGKKESHTYDYIKQLSYDEFEQRKYLKYGNDTETNYTYDPVMRRLQQQQVKSGSRQVMNNAYGYDLVGNVLNIKNTAPIVNNTLGGTASHEYQYDDFYRLKSAKATYQGEFTKAGYELNMSYNKMHNITKKDLVHTVNNEQKGYVLDYNYDNALHPNAPNKITESGKAEPREYIYDGNGNPTSYTEEKSFRKMTWDEDNRLMGINENGRIHQFTYDAGGERVIKSSGDSQNVAINGETAATIVHTDDYTGYVSPYFVISKGKFTKHYFEGAGRIVSKLGNGTFAQPLGITAGGVNYTKLTAEQQKAMDTYIRSLGVPPGPPTQQGIYATPEFTGNPYPSEVIKPVEENQEPPEGWPRNPIFNAPGDVPGPPVQFGPPIEPATVKPGEGFTGIGMPEKDIFYFHSDHLGSTSYITNKNGSVSQHVEYIAFGEVLFEEHSSSFSSPYLFNGKELDRETNLSYYGARYLDMKTSLWLNVDPLAEKYINMSSYAYCFNNPINSVDPDGKRVLFINGHWQSGWRGSVIGSDTPGKGYWGTGFGLAAQRFFKDYSKVRDSDYIDGSSSFGGDMSGQDRYNSGYEYAKNNLAALTDGLKEGEEFNMVTHSEGAAYGAGIAAYLISAGYKVNTVVHLSADEGDEFTTPSQPNTYQFAYDDGFFGDFITGSLPIKGTDKFGIGADYSLDPMTVHGSSRSSSVFKWIKSLQEANINLNISKNKSWLSQTGGTYPFTNINNNELSTSDGTSTVRNSTASSNGPILEE